ncbi:MAG: ABC transporter permease [bacterium]|nr:ABC transporter permease [bacterium]
MTDSTLKLPKPGSAPPAFAGIGRAWGRVSPSLVPALAVLTAILITIPFMILTGGRGDIGRGLNIAGTAYAALVEGAMGLAVNDQVSADDFALVTTLANASNGLSQGDLRELARAVNDYGAAGAENARAYQAALAAFSGLDEDALTDIGESVEGLRAIGAETLDAMLPLITELEAADRGDVRALAETIRGDGAITPESRAAVTALAPAAEALDDDTLFAYMRFVDEYGIVRLSRFPERLASLDEREIALDAPALTTLAALTAENVPVDLAGAARVAGVVERLEATAITDVGALSSQIAQLRGLYEGELLTVEDVSTAIRDQLPAALADNLIVRRPGDRLIIDRANAPFGAVLGDANTPDDPADDRIDVAYLRLPGAALLFFPANLESMIVRSIPFIIAGLAVALGFKAGLFNIGAEGQLYAGATVAVWVGFSPLFAQLPALIHIPLVIVAGIFGGALWGAIPGLLKAYTGAHEVIVTIMLNYIAVLIVDWLIKSTAPILLLDPTASTPRTPFIDAAAALPRFSTIPAWLFLLAGALTALFTFLTHRESIRQTPGAAVRPLALGVLVAGGGLFLQWIAVRNALHVGFVVMLLAVWFTDWFLSRTTLGFELRTVGANPDAARYAGMSVPRNIVLALAMSGALAGLAGTIEVSGVQLNMQPEFFSGLGFDAIAVALLARNNIRSMIAAGLLWGSLLTGAGLMQLRADISIDLVKIIQALIIMFIAADAIIRYLWAIPKTAEKTSVSTFSKGWGG